MGKYGLRTGKLRVTKKQVAAKFQVLVGKVSGFFGKVSGCFGKISGFDRSTCFSGSPFSYADEYYR